MRESVLGTYESLYDQNQRIGNFQQKKPKFRKEVVSKAAIENCIRDIAGVKHPLVGVTSSNVTCNHSPCDCHVQIGVGRLITNNNSQNCDDPSPKPTVVKTEHAK